MELAQHFSVFQTPPDGATAGLAGVGTLLKLSDDIRYLRTQPTTVERTMTYPSADGALSTPVSTGEACKWWDVVCQTKELPPTAKPGDSLPFFPEALTVSDPISRAILSSTKQVGLILLGVIVVAIGLYALVK